MRVFEIKLEKEGGLFLAHFITLEGQVICVVAFDSIEDVFVDDEYLDRYVGAVLNGERVAMLPASVKQEVEKMNEAAAY